MRVPEIEDSRTRYYKNKKVREQLLQNFIILPYKIFKQMKRTFFIIIFSFLTSFNIYSQTITVTSPGGNISFDLILGDQLKIAAKYKDKIILKPSEINMKLQDRILGVKSHLDKVKKISNRERIENPIHVKSNGIDNNYNEKIVYFHDGYYVIIRAYDDGFAYRFGAMLPDSITVISEKGDYVFDGNHNLWWGKEKRFQSSNQVFYDYKSIRNVSNNDLASLPLMLDIYDGPKVVITESDLIDYPGMWFRGNNDLSLSRVSPRYPEKIEKHSDRDLRIVSRKDYIAKTTGTRTFPWRIFAIAEQDKDLINNQLPYLLASPSKIKDTKWIKPGKVAWDWWNANNIYGVDFKAGINTETYKYYIDFASKYGLEYILLDEGWYKLGDIEAIVPDIDLPELIDYANKKNVGIILWCVWKTLDEKLEVLAKFEEMGIKGIKVDFMNRDDQQMVNFYHKIAKLAAQHHLLVDFHGSYKPAGLRRMYPNVLTREGVNGGEEFKWSMHQTPEHDLIIPFCRMLAGPMDYTPGAMHNAQLKDYRPIFDTPMSMGTRCHQLAMYVCYESPLQMLCDAPSNYYKEPQCMEFLSVVPTVWDTTIVLDAKVSDYLIIARKNGDDWYIGAMTDWDERDIMLDLSFLPKGKQYNMNMYVDGPNANRIAIDFKQIKKKVDRSFKQKIHLAKGGGMAIMLKQI